MVKKSAPAAPKKAPAAPKAAPKAAKKPIAKAPKPPSPVQQRLKNRDGPKWDLSKLGMGQFLTMTSYMTVLGIGNMVSVRNQHGHTMQMSKSLVETMYSATHYEREVALNMTGLAELLQSVQDVVFTVNFKKQASELNTAQALINAPADAYTDPKKLA